VTIHIRRREFIIALGSMTAAWPGAARAQYPIVGVVSSRSLADSAMSIAAFRRGLADSGYVDGSRRAVGPTRSYARPRSDKNRTKHSGSRFCASSLQSIRPIFGDRVCVRCSQIERSRARRSCGGRGRSFADRTHEDDKETVSLGRGKVRYCG
jgi:hypothetical protein